MGLNGTTNYNEVNYSFNHHHSSTPHLFVFQSDDSNLIDDTVELSQFKTQKIPVKEPIYSSAYDIRNKTAIQQDDAVKRISEKYDIVGTIKERQNSITADPLAVTEDDIARIEMFFRGNKTQVWVCRTMANLYFEIGTASSNSSWQLSFTGVPLLLLDSGDTRSRNKRQLQLILAEKGTGFTLWKDIIDNLTAYRIQEQHFHTLYLSSDHRQRLGLSFNDGKLAMEFHKIIDKLTSDPANISLSGPGKKKDKMKEKIIKYKAPRKADISLPCNFNHVTNVDPTDKTRYFSMQLFSKKAATDMPAPQTGITEKVLSDNLKSIQV